MKLKRVARLAAGGICLGTAVMLIAPYVLNYVSRAAVINAPIISVKSPFDGVLVSPALTPATAVLPDTAVVELRASRSSRTELARLDARIATLIREEASIEREIKTLRKLDAELVSRMRDVRELARNVLEAQLDGLKGELASARERQSRLHRDADRLSKLSNVGSAAQTQADTAQSLAREARGEVARLSAEVDQVEREISGIEDDVLPGIGTEDGSYALQRQDELAIRLADLVGRKERFAAQRAGLKLEADAIRQEVVRFDKFAPVLPNGAVVWSATPAQGSAIASGDEVLQLLDCSRRFVEVFVDETAFEAIQPGDTARVKLRGSQKTFRATIEALRGSGSQPATGLLAAVPGMAGEGSLSVLLRLDAANVTGAGVAESFCDVGRTAEVRFDRGYGNLLATPGGWFENVMRQVAPSLFAWFSPGEGNVTDAG